MAGLLCGRLFVMIMRLSVSVHLCRRSSSLSPLALNVNVQPAVCAEENVDTVVNEGAVGPVVALLTLFTAPLEPKTVASISQPLPKCAPQGICHHPS